MTSNPIRWIEAALADLEAIVDYIAVEDPAAASRLLRRVVAHIQQLADHPRSGSRPQELGRDTRYRQIVEPPCRIFYRFDGHTVHILHIMRAERQIQRRRLTRRPPRE